MGSEKHRSLTINRESIMKTFNKVSTRFSPSNNTFTVSVNGCVELADATQRQAESFIDGLLESCVISATRHKQILRGLRQFY